MPLVRANQRKTVLDNTQFTLEAKSDESILIKNVRVYNPSGTHATFNTERTTVGYFRVSGQLGNHLAFTPGAARHAHSITTGDTVAADQTSFVDLLDAVGGDVGIKTLGGLTASTTYPEAMDYNAAAIVGYKGLLGLLFDKGLFSGYPVATGETFSITGVHQADSIVEVLYDVYDPGDISKDMPNGSAATEFMYVIYGNAGASINTTGYTELTTRVNPVDFNAFPFGTEVPGNTEITFHGILGSDFVPGETDGTDGISTRYLRLTRDRTVLFDDDKNGLLMYNQDYVNNQVADQVAKGHSVIGNYTELDLREPFWWMENNVFLPGQELTVELNTVQEGSGQNIVIAEQEIGFIVTSVRT